MKVEEDIKKYIKFNVSWHSLSPFQEYAAARPQTRLTRPYSYHRLFHREDPKNIIKLYILLVIMGVFSLHQVLQLQPCNTLKLTSWIICSGTPDNTVALVHKGKEPSKIMKIL